MKVQVVFSLHQQKASPDFVFGKKGPSQMLWSNKADLEQFKKLTLSDDPRDLGIVLMGSSTFRSLPKKLSDRVHYVLSSKGEQQKEKIKTQLGEIPDLVLSSIQEFKEHSRSLNEEEKVSVIGGFEVIKSIIENQVDFNHECNGEHDHQFDYNVQDIWLTLISGEFNSTGELITLESSELHQLFLDYDLIEIKELDQNVSLYHYSRKNPAKPYQEWVPEEE